MSLLPESEARAALAAVYAVAEADGEVDPRERALIDAGAAALGVAPPTEGISPGALADLVADPTHRLRTVQAMELVALMDGKVVDEEIAAVEAFSTALGVDDPRLNNLRQIRHRHLRLLQMDLMRRSPMAGMAWELWARDGIRGVMRFTTAPYSQRGDGELAKRYNQLGLLPEGTFGRAYWTHMTTRGFALPGEPAGFPEELVRHDLSHVLSGYDTDVPGECQNAAFIAGFLEDDPFSYLFMVAVHCHLDITIFPNDPSQASLAFDPGLVLPALERGMRVNRNLYGLDWDFWADFSRPLDEVRAELGIEPLPQA